MQRVRFKDFKNDGQESFMIRSMFVLSLLLGSLASASIPPLKITPLGKPDAPVAGTFNRNLSSEPENFSPLVGNEYASRQVYEYVSEGLLWLNPETFEFE